MKTLLRLAELSTKTSTPFEITPDAAALQSIATQLDLLDLRKLRFEGKLEAQGKTDWRLSATLGATVVQPCVVTLAPVSTRIEEDIIRHYLADWSDPDETEVEMPEDDTSEPLPVSLDLIEIMTEALALALPLYPRADHAELGTATYAGKDVKPLSDDDVKPFAGLADLKKKLDDQT